MQANLVVKCDGCGKNLGQVHIDTADWAKDLKRKVDKVILAHRQECYCYRQVEELV